jgi:hypothetical protein
MKYMILALLTTILLVSADTVAKPSNKSRFIPLLKTKLGAYEVVSANSALCVNSQLSFINSAVPDEGFSLGPQIVFDSLHNGTQTIKKPNFCFITSSLKYKSDGIENGLRMSRCENPAHEKTIRQAIYFLANDMLSYTLSEPNVECTFKKVANSE